jgi:hypothetical protein
MLEAITIAVAILVCLAALVISSAPRRESLSQPLWEPSPGGPWVPSSARSRGRRPPPG